MGKYRIPSINSKYYMPKEKYLATLYWCLQYPLWLKELEDLEPDTGKAIEYHKDHVQMSNEYDPVSDLAIRRAEIAKKKELLENTIRKIDARIYKWLLQGIAYGVPEYRLRQNGMTCGHNYYYKKRQQVIYEISKKI